MLRKVRHLVQRLLAVEDPNQPPLFLDRKLEQPSRCRWLVAGCGLHARAGFGIRPVMVWTTDIVADHITAAEIGAQVAAIRTGNGQRSALSAECDDATIKEVVPFNATGRHVRRKAQRIPILVVPTDALGRDATAPL